MTTNMSNKAMKAEAKRRKFFYTGWVYEVYHPDKPRKTLRRFELRYEATDYIAFVAETDILYATQLLMKKIVVNNGGGNVNKHSFVQWIKPVKSIKATVDISYSAEV